MLKLFEVSGFKNFGNKLTFDFSDTSDYKFNTSCIENDTVSKAIVYGKNSIGKSNLGLAIFDIVSTLTDKNVTPQLYDYYLTAGNSHGYAEFHYVFQFGSDEIDYLYRKETAKTTIYEQLLINGEEFIQRDNDNFTINNNLQLYAITLNNPKSMGNMSYLKFVINNYPFTEDEPLGKLINFVSHMLWFRNLDENRYIGYANDSSDYMTFITEDSTKNEFQNLLHKAGLEENLVVINDADGQKRLYFDTTPPLPFYRVASSGTKALYTLFYWIKSAPEVSFIFIDEFDAFYHYELAETIVCMLEDMSRIQVVLTSHNTNLLSNKIMRPDCYFILTKDKITSLKNSTDRELREGHNLEKLYMSGEFGGI